MTQIVRASLNESDFQRLCAGKVVILETPLYRLEIALADIGWIAMQKALSAARERPEAEGLIKRNPQATAEEDQL
jgi:hypothetical protein